MYGRRVNTCIHTNIVIGHHLNEYSCIWNSLEPSSWPCFLSKREILLILNKYVLITRLSQYDIQVLKTFPVPSHHCYYTEIKCHGIAASSHQSKSLSLSRRLHNTLAEMVFTFPYCKRLEYFNNFQPCSKGLPG